MILAPAPFQPPISHHFHWRSSLCLENQAVALSPVSILFVSLSPLLWLTICCCVFAGVAEVETIYLVWKCETLQQDEPALPPSGFLSPPIANRHLFHLRWISNVLQLQNSCSWWYSQHPWTIRGRQSKAIVRSLLPHNRRIALEVGLLLSFLLVKTQIVCACFSCFIFCVFAVFLLFQP